MVKVFVDVVHPSPAIDRPVGRNSNAHTGVAYYGRGELIDLGRSALEQGMGLAMHALGNCAIDIALDAMAELSVAPRRDTLLDCASSTSSSPAASKRSEPPTWVSPW